MTRVLVIDPHAPDAGAVNEAARVLRGGGLVALPTETVYGLAACALDESAVGRVFLAKGRPSSHPLIAHVLGEEDAQGLARSWPDRAHRLAAAFWPGPLTLVVDRASGGPIAVSGGGDSIAVRAPAHPVARAVIRALGQPVAAPSANRYQGLSPTTASHVLRELGDSVELVLDAGPCEAGIESTVVDVRGSQPCLLRPGAIDLRALRAVMADVSRGEAAALIRDQLRPSPGMQARHYSPRAILRVARDRDSAEALAASLSAEGEYVGLLVRGPLSKPASPRVESRQLAQDPKAFAHSLFATLHDLDALGVNAIVVEDVPGEDEWLAVADRLTRAACPR